MSGLFTGALGCHDHIRVWITCEVKCWCSGGKDRSYEGMVLGSVSSGCHHQSSLHSITSKNCESCHCDALKFNVSRNDVSCYQVL